MDIENHKEAVKLAMESLGMSPEEFGMLLLKTNFGRSDNA